MIPARAGRLSKRPHHADWQGNRRIGASGSICGATSWLLRQSEIREVVLEDAMRVVRQLGKRNPTTNHDRTLGLRPLVFNLRCDLLLLELFGDRLLRLPHGPVAAALDVRFGPAHCDLGSLEREVKLLLLDNLEDAVYFKNSSLLKTL